MKNKFSFKKIGILIAGLLILAIAAPLAAQTAPVIKPSADGRQEFPAIKKIGPGIFRLGEIQIHKKAGSITFPAKINMNKGLIEYLLVRSSGKVHESLLRTDVDPYYLNLAFLLLGFEGTDAPLQTQGASETPRGEAVQITIIHRAGEKVKHSDAAALILKKTKDKSETVPINWIYTGSKILQGEFLAQESGSIVAVYRDPAALIDNASPGGDNDEIWFVNQEVTPAAGTEVIVTIQAK